MMKKVLILTGVLIAVLLTALPVCASTITGATYIGTVTVTNTLTAATNVSVPFTLSTSNLITYNYVNSTLSNTAMQINGTDIPYMPARTGQTAWMMFAPSVPTGASTAKLYTGGGDMSSKIRYFPAATGMTIVDSVDLEVGNNFEIEIKGFFDFTEWSAGSYIIYRNGFTANMTAADEINTQITLDTFATKTLIMNGLTSGEHTFKITGDGADLKVIWDGVTKDTETLGGASVNPQAFDWFYLGWGGQTKIPVAYLEYLKVTVSGVLQSHIKWENGATFTDLSGNGHFATPTWRTTTSDADVSAVLSTFETNNLSQAGSYSIAGGVTFITDVPDDADFPSGSAYEEGETGGMVVDELVDPALAEADIPEAFFWYPIAFAVAIGLGFAAYGLTKTLLVQSIVSGVVMAGFCGGGVLGDGLLPWFTVVVFGIEAAMIIIIQEKFAT